MMTETTQDYICLKFELKYIVTKNEAVNFDLKPQTMMNSLQLWVNSVA